MVVVAARKEDRRVEEDVIRHRIAVATLWQHGGPAVLLGNEQRALTLTADEPRSHPLERH